MLSRVFCLCLLASFANATCTDALNLVLAKGAVTQAEVVAAGQFPNFKALQTNFTCSARR